MGPWIWLHGASGAAASYAELCARRPGSIALDLPGRGSQPGPALSSVAEMADWLADRCLHEGWERPVLIGHSMGGGVALTTALAGKLPLGGLALVSSSARLKVSPAILAAVAASTPESPYRLDAAFGPDASAQAIEDYATAVAGLPTATALADWRACDGFDVRAQLRVLDIPAVVLHGDADRLTPARFQASLAEAIGAQRVELPGGHMLPWEQPEALLSSLETAFSTAPVAGASD